MNSKVFNIILIALIAINLIAMGAFFLWQSPFSLFSSKDTEAEPITAQDLSAEEVQELSINTESLITNLYNDQFVVIEFSILVSDVKAKEELQKRMSEIKAISIKTLADKTPSDLRGRDGLATLESELMEQFNEILYQGEVIRVLTIDRKIQ